MVWAAISTDYKSDIIFIKENINSDVYLNFLTENQIIEKIDEKFGRWNWSFMHNGATSHTKNNNCLLKLGNFFPG